MKWTRRILIALVILAGLITALWWEENWRGQKIWEESCTRLRAAGEPVEIEDIIPPMIPDEENVAAAPIFAEVVASTIEKRESTRLGRIGADWVYKGPLGYERIPSGRPMSRADLSQVTQWAEFMRGCFPSNPPSQPIADPADEVLYYYAQWNAEWQEIRMALGRPKCRWPLQYEDGLGMQMLHLSCFHKLAINTRGWLAALAAKGDAAAYVDLLTMLLKLERSVGRQPESLVSHLTGCTMIMNTLQAWQHSLPLAVLSEAQLANLQTQLEQLHLREGLTAMQCDRVTFLHTCLRSPSQHLALYLDGTNLVPRNWPDWAERVERATFRTMLTARPEGWWRADFATFQESVHAANIGCIDADGLMVNKPHIDGMEAAAQQTASLSAWHSFSRHALSAAIFMRPRILTRTANTHATVRSAIVWCAAERFRLKHGRLPQNQVELVPEFLHAVLLDPVTGNPLRYVVRENDALLVYSLGWNGRDDGGVRDRDINEGDWGWASDPMLLVGPDEIREWAEEDKERADKASGPTPTRKSSRRTTKRSPIKSTH